MRIVHTADWHLGRSLYGRRRYEEFAAFLDWLADCLAVQQADVLLVAGDVFDSSTPSHRAQELYYRFLFRVRETGCRHVVVTGGNHDSPSFLDAPRELLRHMNVHVVGAAGDPRDEVLALADSSGEVALIVCAVPCLRDRDVRTVAAGETPDDKQRKLIEGIARHYAAVCREAQQRREALDRPVPIVATGHLFAAGGRTVEGDGVRELYVGSLARVGADAFPACIDYLALGHLHVPQMVADRPDMRYSGSPLPVGFGEAGQEKCVLLVEFDGLRPAVTTIAVPCFQQLVRLQGGLQDILERIAALKSAQSRAWLEILCSDAAAPVELAARLQDAVAESRLEILRIRNPRAIERALAPQAEGETLEHLDVHEVFQRCLDAFDVPAERRPALLDTYGRTLTALYEEDPRAE